MWHDIFKIQEKSDMQYQKNMFYFARYIFTVFCRFVFIFREI
jgi:hypothetical protein